jgi:hypothetical protein
LTHIRVEVEPSKNEGYITNFIGIAEIRNELNKPISFNGLISVYEDHGTGSRFGEKDSQANVHHPKVSWVGCEKRDREAPVRFLPYQARVDEELHPSHRTIENVAFRLNIVHR